MLLNHGPAIIYLVCYCTMVLTSPVLCVIEPLSWHHLYSVLLNHGPGITCIVCYGPMVLASTLVSVIDPWS